METQVEDPHFKMPTRFAQAGSAGESHCESMIQHSVLTPVELIRELLHPEDIKACNRKLQSIYCQATVFKSQRILGTCGPFTICLTSTI